MNRTPFILGFVLLIGLMVIRILDPYPVKAGRDFYFDSLQQIKPRAYQDVGVRIVDIDEASLRELGQWPWPRDMLADLVTQLQSYGAAVVVFDVLFVEKDRYSPSNLLERNTFSGLTLPDGARENLLQIDFDAVFAETFANIPVVLGTAQTPETGKPTETAVAEVIEFGENLIDVLPRMGASTSIIPVLKDAAAGIGSVSVEGYGQTSVIRTVPLIWNGSQGPMPSLALEALRVALGETSYILWGTEGTLGSVSAVGVGEIDIPTLFDGQIWVKFRSYQPDLYVSAHQVLDETYDPALAEKLQNTIVFVGSSAAGLLDIRATALRQSVPGVSIHAQIVEQILLGTYLKRTDWIQGVEILTLILLGLIVLYRMTLSGPIWSFVTGFFSAFIVVIASWVAYATQGILFDATFPLVGGFLAFATVAGYQFVITDYDKRQIRLSFSKYVAPTVLEQIEKSRYQLELGGITKPVTVMFCDIRDFTTLSETVEASDLVALLNGLFDKLSFEILDQEGTIDKFIGDSVMAFWNAPIETPDHAARACRAAIQMRTAIKDFNQSKPGSPIRIAIGINSGNACVGNVGSRKRFDYSVIGDTVNVASRVETTCRHVGFDIVATARTVQMAPDIACLYSGIVDLKGKTDLTRIFIILGDSTFAQSDDFKKLKTDHDLLVKAISSGLDQATIADRLDICMSHARNAGVDLVEFYEKIPGRYDDFRAIDQVEPLQERA
ncbi:hypothetical protein SuNHUV7_40340 (plasmid) [Pseudoseohaeicola sp. NH-UV-7]|uniref:CHASE2 domain-containing protein n=1 Tax=Sulfitobacter sp. TBRI5 TaxID=2989732 RepID=UPI003A67B86B